MKLSFVAHSSINDYSKFDCGNEALNHFLNKRAKTEEAMRLSKTKVAINENHDVVGFYTIAPAIISKNSLGSKDGRGMVYSEIPAIRICRLAVDRRQQKSGIGKILLRDALLRCLSMSNQFGGRVVLVDAKDEQVSHFYAKFGFKPIKDNPLILVLKIATIEKSLLEK